MRRLLLTPLILSAVGCTAVAEPPMMVEFPPDLAAMISPPAQAPVAPPPAPLKRVQRIGAATVYAFDPDETYPVRVSPGRLTVLQLGKGEELTAQPALGDLVEDHWNVSMTRGANDSVVVTALKSGLATNLFVTTNVGDYQIDLTSVAKGGMSRVRWIYPRDIPAPKPRATAPAFDSTAVSHSFSLSGDSPRWKPEQVLENGGKTYIVFPPNLGPMVGVPALFAITPSGGKSAIPFRIENKRFAVVDGPITVADLVLDGETVRIKRGS